MYFSKITLLTFLSASTAVFAYNDASSYGSSLYARYAYPEADIYRLDTDLYTRDAAPASHPEVIMNRFVARANLELRDKCSQCSKLCYTAGASKNCKSYCEKKLPNACGKKAPATAGSADPPAGAATDPVAAVPAPA